MLNKKQVLIIDLDDELRDAIPVCFESQQDYLTFGFDDGNEAIEFIKSNGPPFLVISEIKLPNESAVHLHRFLKENHPDSKFVICSYGSKFSSPYFKEQNIYHSILKPLVIEQCNQMVEKLSSQQEIMPEESSGYFPLNIKLLFKLSVAPCDIYIKTGEKNFVKLLHANDTFNQADFNKYESKQLKYLYYPSSDKMNVMQAVEEHLSNIFKSQPTSTLTPPTSVVDALIDGISQLGFNPTVVDACQNVIKENLKAIEKIKELNIYLSELAKVPDSYIAVHSQIMSVIGVTIANEMEWRSPIIVNKIVAASFMHDLALVKRSDFLNENIKELEADKDHPSEMAKIIQSLKNFPSDIDKLILDHHEQPDGSGFPRKLYASHFTPLTAVFNIAHELSHLIYQSKSNLTQMTSDLMLEHLKAKGYDRPVFKKINDCIKQITFF